MKKRNYILMMVLCLTVIVGGCGEKKQQNNTESKDQVEDSSQEEQEESSQEDSSQEDTETEGGTVESSSEDVLDFKVTDYVKLGEYKGLKVTYPAVSEVTDEEVKEYIQEQLEENTEYKEDENRVAQEGDSVNIDYTGTVDGEEFEGGSDTGYDLVLGSEDFLPDFENGLIGKKAGETAVVTVNFPEDYDEGSLSGKKAEFTVKVNSVSEVIVPEYNDEFVKQVSDDKTVADYEASVKEELAASAKDESDMEAGENALRAAMENATVDGYPQPLYDFFYDDTVAGYQAYAEMMGMEYEEFLDGFMSEDDIKEVVVESVNDYLVSRAILEQEKMEVTDQDYAASAEKMAADYEYETLEEFEADYGKTYIMTQIVREKALDFVRGSAKLQEVSQEEYYGDDEEELEVEEEE